MAGDSFGSAFISYYKTRVLFDAAGPGHISNVLEFLLHFEQFFSGDSLLFALRKFKQNPEPIETKASCDIGRNAENRLRILAIHVEIRIGVPGNTLENLERVLAQFQDRLCHF